MNADDFLHTVVRPVLKTMEMWSPAAEKLLIMTAAHESGGFRHRVQIGGPALSYFQIEPPSFSDVWDRYLETRPAKKAKVEQFLPADIDPLAALENDDKFACAIARMKYAMVPAVLPDVGDEMGLAAYAKEYWNTPLGKATAEKYFDDFKSWGPVDIPLEWGQQIT